MADFLARRWRRQPQGPVEIAARWQPKIAGAWIGSIPQQDLISRAAITTLGPRVPLVGGGLGHRGITGSEETRIPFPTVTTFGWTMLVVAQVNAISTDYAPLFDDQGRKCSLFLDTAGAFNYFAIENGGDPNGLPQRIALGRQLAVCVRGSDAAVCVDGLYFGERVEGPGVSVPAYTSLGANPSGGGGTLTAVYGARVIWNRLLSGGEMIEVSRAPWDVFRPRRAITYSLPDGGTTYNDSVTETAAANDTINSFATLPSGVVESASGADSVAATRVGAGVISESASAADSVNAGAGVYAVSVTESASAADAVAAGAVLVGGLAEAGAATDSVNGTCVFTRAIAEAASAADAVAAGANIYAVSVNESASSADSVSTLAVLTGGVAETAAAADAVVAQLVAVSTIVETGVAVDVLAASGGTVISNIFRAAVNDALAFRCVASDAELAA